MAENGTPEVQVDENVIKKQLADFLFRIYNVEGLSYIPCTDELVCSDYLIVG